ncbi:MAG: bacillithiol biosynthesis cysteine-adding enzyme BshC [Scytonematopsis contorta HA4267-MV1]|jgi:bacillithiol biosynthesis cysteine-adding enzyme BshC|nr:bacillithiol biosynthesis cysteine-adding enzyme BshC [Scytonematopsis contorta HA4267-MV1]
MTSSILPNITDTPRNRYEAWAESYDERTNSFNWSAPEYLLESVVHYASPKGFLRVLDIGVGTGQASVPYLEAGACVTGIDISPSMLHQAKTKHPQFHALIEWDFNRSLTECGLLAQSFDIILSCGALHFANDLIQSLSNLKSVLTPGGLIGFTYIPFQQRNFSSATKPYTPDDVEEALIKLGFNILEHQSFIAYYDNGDLNDPVFYQKIIARCTQTAISLPAILQEIDRTACIDRSRLITIASRPLMSGSKTTQWTNNLAEIRTENQSLVDALQMQIDAGEIEPRYLPLPKISVESTHKNKCICDVLALMPHPDDESIYVGGTIAALTEAGQSVHLVVATDGGAGRGGKSDQLVKQRDNELSRAGEILGIKKIESLGLADFGKYRNPVRSQPITAAETLRTWGLHKTLALIVAKIRQHRPRVILTLHPEVDPNYSLHGHHLGLGVAALVAFHLAADPEFILADAPNLEAWTVEEHYSPIPFYQSASEIMRIEINKEQKLRAIQAHQTQQYSTQKLIEFLKSNKSEANFETIQLLQARCCNNFLTAIPLKSPQTIEISTFQRDWLSTYDYISERCYPRQALANLLKQQAESWGISPEVLTNIEKLRDSKTVAVVTGQQVGLLGGPAYTLYKALGAIKLARQLEAKGIPAVPIFWMASNDHDLAEVQNVKIFSQRSEPEIISLGLPITHHPVGSTKLGLGVHSLLDEVERSFKNLPHSQEIIAALRTAYHPDATFAEAFARWLNTLTKQQGLIILDPATRDFASLYSNIVFKELFDTKNSQTALKEAQQRLASEGRSEIIPTGRDVLQMFYVDDSGIRRRLSRVEGGFAVHQTNGSPNKYLTNNTLQDILQQHPERFTPSALLRPICQDAVLPTIAYIAGPTEKQYFTQLPEVYTWAEITMPEIVARPSFTVIDSSTANQLNELGGVVNLLTSDNANFQIGYAGLSLEVRQVCDGLKALQRTCFMLLELAKANQPLGEKANTLQQNIEEWLATTASIIESWGANRALKAFSRSTTELPILAKTAFLDLQRSGSPGNPPPTRNISKLAQQLIRLEDTIIREGRKQNKNTVTAFTFISPNNTPQERSLSVAELLATQGKEIISQLLSISGCDVGYTKLVTTYQPLT